MMGYSITEAASVLGVPTERVWELLARGVLAGEAEGETGMRVFLQPRPAPAPVAPADDTITARSNGPERELSPFRELLTEFRSLTERYGQALLALGEARGEVASLRSRVDLLEARIDLRLPMGPPPAASFPTQPLPVKETADDFGARPEAAAEHDDEDAHRPRRRGARRATESFAEALARAEDPSLADLSRGSDADALAAFRSEAEAAEAVEADRVLPREVPPAEPVLVAEEAPGTEPAASAAIDAEPWAAEPGPVVVEPEQEREPEEPEVVDAWAEPVDALAAPVDIGPEPVDAEPQPEEPEPIELMSVVQAESVAAEEPSEDALTAEVPAVEPEPWPEFETATATDVEEAAESVAVEPEPVRPTIEMEPASVEPPSGVGAAESAVDAGVESQPETAAEAEPGDFDAARYTTVIEQPDWYEAEIDDAWPDQTAPGHEAPAAIEEPQGSTTDAHPVDAPEPASQLTGDQMPGAEPAPLEPTESPAGEAPDRSPSEPDEGGADEMELAGGGQGPSVPATSDEDDSLPGSRELDEALGAFGPIAGRAPRDPAVPLDEDEWRPRSFRDTTVHGSSAQGRGGQRLPRSPYTPPPGSGSATRAYRRLRRIFPT